MAKDIPQCFDYKKCTREEIHALRAVNEGTANAHQQRMTLAVIVNKFCRAHDVLYIPGNPGDTAFLNGRSFAGVQILKHLKIPISNLVDTETQ